MLDKRVINNDRQMSNDMTRQIDQYVFDYVVNGNSDPWDMAELMVEMFGGEAEDWASSNTVEAMAAEYLEGLSDEEFAALESEIEEMMGE